MQKETLKPIRVLFSSIEKNKTKKNNKTIYKYSKN